MPTGLEMVPLQEKLSGFVPICANMLRNDPGSGNQGCSTASQATLAVLKLAHLSLSHLFC